MSNTLALAWLELEHEAMVELKQLKSTIASNRVIELINEARDSLTSALGWIELDKETRE